MLYWKDDVKMKKTIRYTIYLSIMILILLFVNFYKFNIIEFPPDVVVGDNLLKKGDTVTQDFEVKGDNLNSIGIKIATYDNVSIKGEIKATLYDDNNTEIVNKNINLDSIKDSLFYTLSIPEQKESKGKKYKLCINVLDLGKSDQLSIWSSTEYEYKMYLNDTVQDKSIAIAYKCKRKNYYIYIYELFVALFIILIESFVKKKER